MKKIMLSFAGILFLAWFLGLNSKAIIFLGIACVIFINRNTLKSLGLVKLFYLIKNCLVNVFKYIKLVFFVIEISRAKKRFNLESSLSELLKSAKVTSDHIYLNSNDVVYSFVYGKKSRKLIMVINNVHGLISKILVNIKKVSLEVKPLINQM